MKTGLYSNLFGWNSCVLSMVLAASAQAAPGDLDTTFTGTGTSRIGFGFGEDYAHAVAVQADGKLVVAGSSGLALFTGGDVSVVRYDTNNVLDTSFGILGKVVTPIGSGNSVAKAVKIQADDKIVVAGYSYNGTNNDFALVRCITPSQRDQSAASR